MKAYLLLKLVVLAQQGLLSSRPPVNAVLRTNGANVAHERNKGLHQCHLPVRFTAQPVHNISVNNNGKLLNSSLRAFL